MKKTPYPSLSICSSIYLNSWVHPYFLLQEKKSRLPLENSGFKESEKLTTAFLWKTVLPDILPSLHYTLSTNCLSRKSFLLYPGSPQYRFHTEELKTKNSNSTKKGRPSDHQDPVRAVTGSLSVPPGQLLIPVHQENTSEWYSGASVAVCFGWEPGLVHIQKWRTAHQGQWPPAALWCIQGLSTRSVNKTVQVIKQETSHNRKLTLAIF